MIQAGPAQPVVTSAEAPDGGPARPVAVVDAPLYTLAGPALKIVVVNDNRPRIAGPALPIVAASGAQAGAPVAGPPIPVYVVSGSLYIQKVLGLAPANLIAYWPLAETSGTIADNAEGTAARDGAYTAVTLGGAGIGDGRNAPSFDGAASFVNVFSTSLRDAFSAAAGTVALWAKLSAAGIWTDGTSRRIVRLAVDANNEVRLLRTTTNNQLQLSYVAGGTATQRNKGSLSTTDWFHLALTWNKAADEVKAYFGGVQEGATIAGLGTWVGQLAATTSVIGASVTTPNSVWNGSIAHVAVWNAALTGAQIAALATV